MDQKAAPIFLFSPKKLLKEKSGERFYFCQALKCRKKILFSYLISDPFIDENKKMDCKFAANTEEIDNLTDLYSRYYKFVENFTPHEKTNDLEYILSENPTLESLNDRFQRYCIEKSEEFTKEYLTIHKDLLAQIDTTPPKITVPAKKSLVDKFFKKRGASSKKT